MSWRTRRGPANENTLLAVRDLERPTDSATFRQRINNSAERNLVLVVEDQALIRMAAVGMVEDAGFEVLDAESADAAIIILSARSDIHLVLTDVEMPGTMDGIKLAYYVRKRWPPVLLIVVSGRMIVAEDQLPSGSRFFAKPYDDAKLIAAMTAMLASDEVNARGNHPPLT